MTDRTTNSNEETRSESAVVATEQSRSVERETAAASSGEPTKESSTVSPTGSSDTTKPTETTGDTGAREGITFEAKGVIPKLEGREGKLWVGESADAGLLVTYNSDGSISVAMKNSEGEESFSLPAGAFNEGDAFIFHFSADAGSKAVFTFDNLTTGKIFQEETTAVKILNSFETLKPVEYADGRGIQSVDVRKGYEDYDGTTVTPDGTVEGDDTNNIIDEDFRDADGDTVTNGDDFIDAQGGADFAAGGAGNDVIDGGDGDDTLEGGAGNDQLIGGNGADYLSGGDGDDNIFADAPGSEVKGVGDYIDAGAGNDTIMAGPGDFVDGGKGLYNILVPYKPAGAQLFLNANGHSGYLQYLNGSKLTFQNIQNIQGLNQNPVFTTNGGTTPTMTANTGPLYNPNNPPDGTVQGTIQNDVIDHDYTGDPHNDMVDANDAILPGDVGDMDVIEAYAGDDTITAGADDDEVYAGLGNDWAQGNLGEDLIFGEDGNDTIFGDNALDATFVGGDDAMTSGILGGGDFCVDDDDELCLDFDTKKDMLTEDVWFAEYQVVVTGIDGQIIGDCNIVEGNNGQLQVELAQAVAVDTQVVLKIVGGTADQAAPTYNEFTSLVNFFQGPGASMINTSDTQWWVADQAHMDFLNSGANYGSTNFWTHNGWGPGSVANTLFSQPTAQNPNPTQAGSPSDIYIGTDALVNDFRLVDDQGNTITGDTVTLTVEAGQTVSNAVTVVANLETMVRGMPQGQFYNVFEGDEYFTIEIDSIGGAAPVNAGTKVVDIQDAETDVYSPIAFDLNGNGEIDTTGNSTAYGHDYAGGATVLFDIDNNALTGDANGEEQIEWMDGTGDGLLIDTTGLSFGDQVTGEHLFGDEGGTYGNGYMKLAQLRDANSDTVINGSELNNLGIWVDDGDGDYEAGELQTLTENGISEIATTYTTVLDSDGNEMYRSVTEVDAELAENVTYTLTGPDAQYFVIDPATGKVTYAPGFTPDYNNPQDQGADNTYNFNVVRTCDDPFEQTVEPVSITIKDPCIGDDDMLYGGNGDDMIDGQGGDDILVGDLGDDLIEGGCGEDIIFGDNSNADEDLDPSDGFISVIDDNPCFCIDLSTTKSMYTEDVWFAEKVTGGGGPDPIGMISGECDLVEGETGTYKVQLDSPVSVDTTFTIVLTDLSANFSHVSTFAEYFYHNGTGPLSIGDETQYFAVNSGHLSDMDNYWGNLNNFFNNDNPDSAATNDPLTDTIVGVANLTNDYELIDQFGQELTVPTITVTVPAGQTMSEEFMVETNVETILSPNWANQNGGVQHEGTEQFQIQITEINGVAVVEDPKVVNIENLASYTYSPIAFDLNCDGEINVTGNSTAYNHAYEAGTPTVLFDIDGNAATGNANGEEDIEWLDGSGDGLLIDMTGLTIGDQVTGAALFGDQGGLYANGYIKLSDTRDANLDGVINGSELDNLAIWVDDGDAVLEAGELQTLAENGITELDTQFTTTADADGNPMYHSTTEVDAEVTGMVTYSIDPTSPDAEFFQIDPETGKLTYADGFHPDWDNPADADSNNLYQITIVRSGGVFDQPQFEDITIQVTDDGFGGDDELYGGDDNDTILGHSGDDYIEGNAGDDDIDGGFGDDIIYGDTPGDAEGGYVFGGNPGQCQEVIFSFDNVKPGSETASIPNTAQVNDSVIYENVTTFQGVSLSAKVTLGSVTHPDLEVDLANAQGAEILINASGDPAMAGEHATFVVEFFNPVTGDLVEIDPVIGFADLDGGQPETYDLVYIYDQVADVGVTPNTTLEYGFDPSTDSAKAGGLADNGAPYDPDATFAVKLNPASGFKFELHTGAKPTDLTFGKVSEGDYQFEMVGDATGGDDDIVGGWGNDLIYGQGGDDDINSTGEDCDHEGLRDIGYPGLYLADFDPGNDLDTVYGGAGNDSIFTGDDADLIYGGTGNDKIDGGIDADIIYAEDGNDFVVGGEGSDQIYSGDGNDIVYGDEIGGGIHTFPDDTDLVPFNDEDLIYGGQGDDLLYGGDDKDTMFGGFGEDEVYGGIDNDCLYGGEDNDTVYGGDGDDIAYGGLGDDRISADDGDDLVYGGDGNDRIRGGDGNDEIYGGTGNDQIGPGDGEDLVYGGTGDDIVYIGTDGGDPDDIYGDEDRDTFVITGPTDGDCYDGGTGSTAAGDVDDYDILDLSGFDADEFEVIFGGFDELGVGASRFGTVRFFDDMGSVIGESKFKEIEQIIYCFTPGTMIATPRGEIAVEDLNVGDKVLTRDNGMQEISWYGSKPVSKQDMQDDPSLKPVMIQAGALGHGLPEQDLMVSPNHRVLVSNMNTELYFGESEVLVAAKHLVGKPGIHTVDVTDTQYIHFMCERHEVVLSNGTWTESFQPGEQALNGLDDDQREELFKLFPELETEAGRDEFTAARTILKAFEAKLAI